MYRPVVEAFFLQAEDGIRYWSVTGVQTCALPIFGRRQIEMYSRLFHTVDHVERVELFAQVAFDVIDRVDEPRVHFYLPAADHAHTAGLADARLVVAVDVSTHGEFGLVLTRIQQPLDLQRVTDGVAAARDRPGDRAGLDAVAVHPDVHFRRGADQVLGLPQVNQKAVRRGVALAQAAEQLGGRHRARFEEGLAGHDLEQVPALERLTRDPHAGGVLTRLVVTGAGDPLGARVGSGRAFARQGLGRMSPHLEVVAVAHGALTAVVNDDEFV